MKKILLILTLLTGCSLEQGINSNQLNQNDYAGYTPLDPEWKIDRVPQAITPEINMLFIIDDSISMQEDQQRLREEMPFMIENIHNANVDYRIGIVTTSSDGELNDISGQRWIDRETPDPIQAFEDASNVGLRGDPLEKGVYSLYLTLTSDMNTDFFRTGSPIHVIVITDEPDGTFYGTDIPSKQDLWDTIDEHKEEAGGFTFTSIVMSIADTSCIGPWGIQVDPSDYLEITNKYPGVQINLCADDWSESIKVLTDDIKGLGTSFGLSEIPVEDTITVHVEHEDVVFFHDDSEWDYNQNTNSVVFTNTIPDETSIVIAEYMLRSNSE
jgi:hypothetical protein